MTIDDIEVLLKETEHNGYPVVVSRENQYLVGFVLRKDLNLALGEIEQSSHVPSDVNKLDIFFYYLFTANAKRNFDGISGQSLVIFTNTSIVQNLGPAPLKLKKVIVRKCTASNVEFLMILFLSFYRF